MALALDLCVLGSGQPFRKPAIIPNIRFHIACRIQCVTILAIFQNEGSGSKTSRDIYHLGTHQYRLQGEGAVAAWTFHQLWHHRRPHPPPFFGLVIIPFLIYIYLTNHTLISCPHSCPCGFFPPKLSPKFPTFSSRSLTKIYCITLSTSIDSIVNNSWQFLTCFLIWKHVSLQTSATHNSMDASHRHKVERNQTQCIHTTCSIYVTRKNKRN